MKRLRVSPSISTLKEQLAAYAKEVRQRALRLPPSPEREEMLKRARIADTELHLDDWANSSELRQPK
jgi:hypothetical protein